MRLQFAALALLIGTVACSPVRVFEHSSTSDYEGTPKRIFILNQLDTAQYSSLPQDFAAAIEPALAKCNISVAVYRSNGMELDSEAKLKAAVRQFKPDAIIGFEVTNRLLGIEVLRETYSVTLYDTALRRQVWREVITTQNHQVGSPYRDDQVGSLIADQLLRTMAADNVIKTCPPFPPG